jgi:hypothetical protein
MPRPKETDQRKVFGVPAELAARIDDYRYANRIKSESETLRRLLEQGLQVEAGRQKRRKSPREE